MRRTPFVVVGAAGVAVGCAGMVAMLPGVVAGGFGALGITGSSALARTLSPVAEPLYITSAALILVGALACSRLVTLLAGAGTTLLYLSMFQLASGMSAGGSMSMTSMEAHGTASSPSADVTAFYSGLVLLAATISLMTWRRHRRACRPLVRLPRALTVRR